MTAETFLSAAIRLFFPQVDEVLVVVGKNEAAWLPSCTPMERRWW
jgi:hypothetical protein